MNKLIILNGTSSSGKSNIIQKVQQKDLWINMGIDMIWGKLLPAEYIMFNNKSHLGFSFQKDEQNLIQTINGPIGEKITNSTIKMVNIATQDGFNVIYDDVILSEFDFCKFFNLNNFNNAYLVGVYCDKEIIKQREKQRGDREIGLAEGQFNIIHKYEQFYDFKINTSNGFNIEDLINYINKYEAIGLQNAYKYFGNKYEVSVN